MAFNVSISEEEAQEIMAGSETQYQLNETASAAINGEISGVIENRNIVISIAESDIMANENNQEESCRRRRRRRKLMAAIPKLI